MWAFVLIISVLVVVILHLHIYRIFILAPYGFSFYEVGEVGICFPTYSFSLLIFGCGYMREFGFLSYRGFCGVVHTYSFSEGEPAKATFYPLPRGNRCAQYIKMTICKTKQNNSYQNDMVKMKIFKLQTL